MGKPKLKFIHFVSPVSNLVIGVTLTMQWLNSWTVDILSVCSPIAHRPPGHVLDKIMLFVQFMSNLCPTIKHGEIQVILDWILCLDKKRTNLGHAGVPKLSPFCPAAGLPGRKQKNDIFLNLSSICPPHLSWTQGTKWGQKWDTFEFNDDKN